jgi:hypothetical protein
MRVFKTVPIGQDIGSGKRNCPKDKRRWKRFEADSRKRAESKKSKEKWKVN